MENSKKETKNNKKQVRLEIDLTKIGYKDLEGKETIYDISHILSNQIYKMTGDLGMLEKAQLSYKTGNLVINSEEEKQQIMAIIKDRRCNIVAILKKTILKILEDGKNI